MAGERTTRKDVPESEAEDGKLVPNCEVSGRQNHVRKATDVPIPGACDYDMAKER